MTNETRDKLQEVANMFIYAILNHEYDYALGIEKCYCTLFGLTHERFIKDMEKLTNIVI